MVPGLNCRESGLRSALQPGGLDWVLLTVRETHFCCHYVLYLVLILSLGCRLFVVGRID